MRFWALASCVLFLWMGSTFVSVAASDNRDMVPYAVSHSFIEDVVQSKEPVLIQFEADWCPYCRKMQPALNEFYKKAQGKIKVRRVNIDQEPALSAQFGIRQLPTLVLLKDGKEVDYQSRVMTADEIQSWVDDVL